MLKYSSFEVFRVRSFSESSFERTFFNINGNYILKRECAKIHFRIEIVVWSIDVDGPKMRNSYDPPNMLDIAKSFHIKFSNFPMFSTTCKPILYQMMCCNEQILRNKMIMEMIIVKDCGAYQLFHFGYGVWDLYMMSLLF